MLHNLSMSTGFSFNSNLLTGHENVVNSYIDAYIYIRSPVYTPAFVMPLLETVTSSEKRKSEVSSSYRVTKHRKKPSHSRTKRKSLYWDPGGTLERIKQPKNLFSRNEDHCISKQVKGNALVSKSKSCRPETITV